MKLSVSCCKTLESFVRSAGYLKNPTRTYKHQHSVEHRERLGTGLFVNPPLLPELSEGSQKSLNLDSLY